MTTSKKALLFVLLVLAAVLYAKPVQAQSSMFADPKARQAGDVLTIVLVERTAASRESGWQNDSDAGLRAAADVSNGSDLSGRFGVDAQFDKSASNRNQSVQKDLLTGTLTARVTGVDEAGNLLVEGERKLSVNGESHLLKVSGVVRPLDVRYDNTVLSYQIAGASIQYQRGGLHRKFFKPALMVRAGVLAVLGAAVFFATQ